MFIRLANSSSILSAMPGKIIIWTKKNVIPIRKMSIKQLFPTLSPPFHMLAGMPMLPHVTSCIRWLCGRAVKQPSIVVPFILWAHLPTFCTKLPVALMTMLMAIWVYLCPSPSSCRVRISKWPLRISYTFARRPLLDSLNSLDTLVCIRRKRRKKLMTDGWMGGWMARHTN